MRAWIGLVFLCACKHQPVLASTLDAADARHAAQFVAGFYPPEQKKWRWTGRQFIAQLSPPEHGPVTLSIAFEVTEPMLRAHPSLTVSCAADGQPLAPETYSKPARYTFSRPLPSRAPIMQIACQVDHTFVPSENGDTRELGIIVTRISLR